MKILSNLFGLFTSGKKSATIAKEVASQTSSVFTTVAKTVGEATASTPATKSLGKILFEGGFLGPEKATVMNLSTLNELKKKGLL